MSAPTKAGLPRLDTFEGLEGFGWTSEEYGASLRDRAFVASRSSQSSLSRPEASIPSALATGFIVALACLGVFS